MELFLFFLGIFLFVAIVIAPYVWLFNCSYYLREIDKKIDNFLKK